MSIQCGMGAIFALLAFWCAYRMRGHDGEVLPPPDKACERNGVECV